jgi:ADP-ribose pyrophosphatase
MSDIEPWAVLDSRYILEEKWIQVKRDIVQLPCGNVVDDYFVCVETDAVLIFPLTDDGEVIFVKQYKHGVEEVLLELPGGCFDPKVEAASEAAGRELMEETGYSAESLMPLTTVFNRPTRSTCTLHYFFAKSVKRVSEQTLDFAENIQIVKIARDDVIPKIVQGDIKVSDSVALCFMALDFIEKQERNNEI